MIRSEQGKEGVVVRSFSHNDNQYELAIFCNDGDFTEVFLEGKSVKLKFDSSTNVILNDKKIGKLRFPYSSDGHDNIVFEFSGIVESAIWEKEKIILDTGINHNKVEAFLDAEVIVTKYLIDKLRSYSDSLKSMFKAMIGEHGNVKFTNIDKGSSEVKLPNFKDDQDFLNNHYSTEGETNG